MPINTGTCGLEKRSFSKARVITRSVRHAQSFSGTGLYPLDLDHAGIVKLSVYDPCGRLLKALINGKEQKACIRPRGMAQARQGSTWYGWKPGAGL